LILVSRFYDETSRPDDFVHRAAAIGHNGFAARHRFEHTHAEGLVLACADEDIRGLNKWLDRLEKAQPEKSPGRFKRLESWNDFAGVRFIARSHAARHHADHIWIGRVKDANEIEKVVHPFPAAQRARRGHHN